MVSRARVPTLVSKASALAAILLALVLAPAASAQVKEDDQPAGAKDPLEMSVTPASENARGIADLTNIIWWLAIFVFVFVEGLLFYVVWRFRKNKTVPKGETHRGHTQAEIFWTLVPALMFVFIGVMSVQAMQTLDKIPAEAQAPGNTIDVLASQFTWTFTYPDGSQSYDQVWLEEDNAYQLAVRSSDVLHAVWMPSFYLKIDAVPGRTNHVWFEPDTPGEYLLQCAEFCKLGHHAMRAKVFVFEDGANGGKIYGPPPGRTLAPAVEVPADVTLSVRMFDLGFEPTALTVPAGKGVHLTMDNTGGTPHNVAIRDTKLQSQNVGGGKSDVFKFVAPEAGTYEFYCAVPGHGDFMKGTLTVTA